MRSLSSICGIATALIALSATPPSAVAQENTAMLNCQAVGWGNGLPEPLGDREGHGISIDQYSCRVDFGPDERRRLEGHDYLGMGRNQRR